jgi:hypothetical protein
VIKAVNERKVSRVSDVLQEVGLQPGTALVFSIERKSENEKGGNSLNIAVTSHARAQ